MKKHILLIIFILIQISPSLSQITFEEGYFINADNQKIDCLIKDMGWVSNPLQFEYKLSNDAELRTAEIKSIKEFGIKDIDKFIRARVKIDQSSSRAGEFSDQKEPDFSEKLVFLKILVEGKASLYQYREGNLTRFFFRTDSTEITPLIFKKYKFDKGSIKENNQFKQQLFVHLGGECISENEFSDIKYYQRDLVRLFVQYNKCQNVNYVDFNERKAPIDFNLYLKLGGNHNSLSLQNFRASSVNTDFESQNSYKIGLEAEFVLPFYKDKWSLAVEPTFQYFKDQQELDYETIDIDYQYIDVALGIRHYFYFNEQSNLFLNGFLLLSWDGKSSIDYSSGTELDIKTSPHFGIGVGYQFQRKLSLEFRYLTKRQLLYDYVNWNAEYNTASVVLGYVIF
jgi:hypothetical protein